MFFKQKKSISVHSDGANIYIQNDELFQEGINNCLECRYYPCVVNRWYGKKKQIQDCDLWNKSQPSGEIIDQR